MNPMNSRNEMNKRILIHSGIVSVIVFLLFFILHYLYPDAAFGIVVGFMVFSFFSYVVNCIRWIDVYGRSHPNVPAREKTWPHFAPDAPDANAICFNVFKWLGSAFVFWHLDAIYMLLKSFLSRHI